MSTPPIAHARAVSAFVQLWAEAASTVLSQIASTAYAMQPVAIEVIPEPAAGDVQLTVTAAGSVRGEMSFRAPVATALHLVKIFTGAEAVGPEPSADDRSALEELFRQIAGHVATSARPKGLEIQLTTVISEAPTWPPAASGWICTAQGAPHQSQLEWKVSSALATALVSAWHETEVPAGPIAPDAKDVSHSRNTEGSKDAGLPSNLDLLMDVELDVSLRFGGRNILLKEILELGPGAVLELDRDIQEEADLLLDGKLIARGEVVSVEGNFGLRITEIVAAQTP
jgi:flagellar motor switch protein FliN